MNCKKQMSTQRLWLLQTDFDDGFMKGGISSHMEIILASDFDCKTIESVMSANLQKQRKAGRTAHRRTCTCVQIVANSGDKVNLLR